VSCRKGIIIIIIIISICAPFFFVLLCMRDLKVSHSQVDEVS
jgi:hypothetical protein